MMSDPKFKAEMRKYTSSPAYKTAMSRASEDIEVNIFMLYLILSCTAYPDSNLFSDIILMIIYDISHSF